MKIVADDKIPFLKGALESKAEVQYLPGADITNEVLRDADALITRTRTKCNANTLADTKVKLICTATIGFDHIDTNWCAQHNIHWTNAPGCNSNSVNQYIAAVLALLVTEKKWDLSQKSMAVVGVGNVGSKVAHTARILGMTVYEVDPPRARKEKSSNFHQLKDIVDKVDVITFHTPLNREGKDKTWHLCDEHLLQNMKKNAVLINTSRGEVVDGTALKHALKEKWIGSAILDVWENEPKIDAQLLDLVWIATPHIAGYSQDGKANGTQMSVQALSKFFKLGMDDWQAMNIPQPEEPIIEINTDMLSDEAVVVKAILHTYPLKRDDASLRKDVNQFEYLRGTYPIRREFSAYKLILQNSSIVLISIMKALGFNLLM